MTKRLFLNKRFLGHFMALITILMWGTTYVSTKVLLENFTPLEILIFRFVIGILALFIVYPKSLKTTKKQEIYFALAGLFGICLYYLFENIALVYTLASNVGVLICAAPFITAFLSKLFVKQEKDAFNIYFFIGFIVAMFGISLICFNGVHLKLNPLGDTLALLAAAVWAIYSILTKKISSFKLPLIPVVRKTFFYGIIFMLPALFFFDFRVEAACFLNSTNLFNIIFLGLGASALCFVTWNYAVKFLGVVKTSIYIYLTPVITVIFAMVILGERLTKFSLLGMILTILGLFISKYKKDKTF